MTPERGIELLQRGQDENGRVDVFEALSVVLAACAEQDKESRRAALTEAAEAPGNPNSVQRATLLALRDREPR